MQPGDWIALSAARSADARLVGNLARRHDVHVVGIARSGDGESLAYPVINLARDGGVEAITEYTGARQLAGFVDSIGGAVLASVLSLLRAGATIVSYGVLDDEPVPVRNSDLIYRNLTWRGFGIDHWLATRSQRGDTMTAELWGATPGGCCPVVRRRCLRTE